MSARVFFAALLLVVCFVPSALAGQIVLRDGLGGYTGTQDTYIDEDDPYGNYGSLWNMRLYMRSHDPEQSALVRFNLTGQIPPGQTITGATLSLWVYQLDDFTSSDWIDVATYRVKHYKTWAESQANWNIFTGSSYWAAPGCENTSWDREAAPDYPPIRFYDDSPVNRYYHWNVTGSVQAFYAGAQNNNGWLVRIAEHDGGTDGLSLNAADAAGYRPYLTITYIPEPNMMLLLLLGTLTTALSAVARRK